VKNIREPAFEVAHLAAGKALNVTSGGTAGGQTFEKFNKQVQSLTSGSH